MNGHVTELMVEQGIDYILCPVCTHVGEKVFLTAPRGYVQGDICYDSPIDGRPITTKQARIEDLRRNGCREYDPSEKEESVRNRAKEETRLEQKLDETVDQTLSTWSPRKKELLEQEIRAGATAEITRKTVNGT